jgi:hypothetical protein
MPVAASQRGEDAGVVDVPGGQVGQCATAVVFVLHAHGAGGSRRQARMAAATHLDGSLLINADDVLVVTQCAAVVDALV